LAKPQVATGPPSEINPTFVTLNSNLQSDGGHPTYLQFWYRGTKEPLVGNRTPLEGPFTSPHAFSQVITTPVEWYSVKYQAIAWNAEGGASGAPVLLWLRSTPPDTYGIPWLLISQAATNTALTITWIATTDVNCHLTIRVSDKPPYKSKELHEKRGTVYYHGTKVGFKWTHEYTQEESGDTLVHTFIFTVPYYFHTYWWYARGTVDGKPSSSRSPFFSYSLVWESGWLTFGSSSRRELVTWFTPKPSFEAIWGATEGNKLDYIGGGVWNCDKIIAGDGVMYSGYQIARSFFWITVPESENEFIVAILLFTPIVMESHMGASMIWPQTLMLQKPIGTEHPNNPPIPADYYQGNYEGNLGSKSFVEADQGIPTQWILSGQAISWINQHRGETCVFAYREAQDINQAPPPNNWETSLGMTAIKILLG
jgi:hypothetical protein